MTQDEADILIDTLRAAIEQQAKEIEDCKRLLESNFKLIRTSHEAELKAKDKEIEELKTKLLYAEDAANKGDLARQQCGGMELQIQELHIKEAQALLAELKPKTEVMP